MATTPGNATNTTTTGIVGFTGTAMTGTAVTNHNLIIGGATSSTLTNVAPSATSGVPVISQGAAADPTFGTAAIAGGGTNATSFSTSTGIVKYDGTSLVTSSSAKIDSSNRIQNSSQPNFIAYLSSNQNNVTGDGTNYTIVFNTEKQDQASNYNNGTGVFTAPVAGTYLINVNVQIFNVGAAHTSALFFLSTSSGGNYVSWQFNPANFKDNLNSAPVLSSSFIVAMALNETASFTIQVSGSTKTVGVSGGSTLTWFSGVLLPC